MDLDLLSVQLALLRGEQVDFTAEHPVSGSERGARPDVEEGRTGSGIRGGPNVRAGEVHAVGGKENVWVDREVRRRVSESLADSIAEHDVADEDGRASEEGGSACDVSLGEKGTDPCAADRFTAYQDRRDDGR